MGRISMDGFSHKTQNASICSPILASRERVHESVAQLFKPLIFKHSFLGVLHLGENTPSTQ